MACFLSVRSRSARGDDSSSVYALVEFTEEDSSTAVVPLQRVIDASGKETCLENPKAGEKVTVLWYNGRKYPALFLSSGTKSFCLAEEQKIIDEDCSADSLDGNASSEEEEELQDGLGIQENKDTLEEQQNKPGVKDNKDTLEEQQDRPDVQGNKDTLREQQTAVAKQDNGGSKKAKRKRRLIKCKNGQSNSSQSNKENTSSTTTKDSDDDFIMRMGRLPMKKIPLNVTYVNDQQKDEETVRKDLEPYAGQLVEMYSSDDDNDEFYRCCARVEKPFEENSFGTVNKRITISVNADDAVARDDPPIHYTSGAKELEYTTIKNSMNTLKCIVESNEEKQKKVNDDLRSDITKINTKMDEANQSLALILAQLIKPNAVHPDGYINKVPLSSATTQSTTSSNSLLAMQHVQSTSGSNSPTVVIPSSPILIQSNNSTPVVISLSPIMTQSNNSPPVVVSLSPVVTQSNNPPPVVIPSSPMVTQSNNSPPVVVSLSPIVTPSPSPVVTQSNNSPPVVVSLSPVVTPSSPTVTQSNNSPPVMVSLSPIVTQSNNSAPVVIPSSPVVTKSNNLPPVVVSSSPVVTQSNNPLPVAIPSSPIVTQSNNSPPVVISSSAIMTPIVTQTTVHVTSGNITSTPYCANFETVATSPSETPPRSSGILDPDDIRCIRSGSCSRRNFAAKLVAKLFDEETRKRSNVSGKLGKMKLNPVLIHYVKSLAFQFYPLEHHQSEKLEWGKCVVSIDEFNRRLNKCAKPTSTE